MTIGALQSLSDAQKSELCEVVEQVVTHFESENRTLPSPSVRPMREVV